MSRLLPTHPRPLRRLSSLRVRLGRDHRAGVWIDADRGHSFGGGPFFFGVFGDGERLDRLHVDLHEDPSRRHAERERLTLGIRLEGFEHRLSRLVENVPERELQVVTENVGHAQLGQMHAVGARHALQVRRLELHHARGLTLAHQCLSLFEHAHRDRRTRGLLHAVGRFGDCFGRRLGFYWLSLCR